MSKITDEDIYAWLDLPAEEEDEDTQEGGAPMRQPNKPKKPSPSHAAEAELVGVS